MAKNDKETHEDVANASQLVACSCRPPVILAGDNKFGTWSWHAKLKDMTNTIAHYVDVDTGVGNAIWIRNFWYLTHNGGGRVTSYAVAQKNLLFIFRKARIKKARMWLPHIFGHEKPAA